MLWLAHARTWRFIYVTGHKTGTSLQNTGGGAISPCQLRRLIHNKAYCADNHYR